MGIVSSSLVSAGAQKDGRFWVTETHVDQLGLKYVYQYLAATGTDTAAILAARAPQITQQLDDNEVAANVANIIANGSLATLTFSYSTATELRTAGRVAYATATLVQAVMIGDFLSSLSDAQLQNIFNMTAVQVTTLRANKLTLAAATATEIRAAAGQ